MTNSNLVGSHRQHFLAPISQLHHFRSFHRPSRHICLPINLHHSLFEGSRPGWESYINLLALAYVAFTGGLWRFSSVSSDPTENSKAN